MTRRLGCPDRRGALQQGYEQLCEWLNYDDETKHYVQHLLNGEYVAPHFQEYREDYLDAADVVEEIGCDELFGWICNRDAFIQPKYCASLSSKKKRKGSKKGWTALDHAARFVVQVLRSSWENDGEWEHGRFDYPGARSGGNGDSDESGNEFYQVWAILRYLQAEWEAANIDDWEPDRLYAS